MMSDEKKPETTEAMGCLAPGCGWRVPYPTRDITTSLLAYREHASGHSHADLVKAGERFTAFELCRAIHRDVWAEPDEDDE